MYNIDSKFYSEDGSFNTEAASLAGRKAQAHAAAEGVRAIADLLGQAASYFKRTPSKASERYIGSATN